jgi:hypothetical protein
MFCHASLGTNEAIERFPVGRRLAFDVAKGRLWAVCAACERWNLSPIEERWEAIEECERLFRGTRLRMSTENIGLARIKEGATLVRIGDPQRPEMAAWRYGDQFQRRRRRHLALAAGGAAVVGAGLLAGPIMGVASAGFASVMNFGTQLYLRRTVTRVSVHGTMLRLNDMMTEHVLIRRARESGFELEVPHKPLSGVYVRFGPHTPRVILGGDDAIRVARQLLPRINRLSGRPRDVTTAVAVLESSHGPKYLFERFSFPGESRRWADSDRKAEHFASTGALVSLPPPVRLALEMSLHEDDERRALEGELAELEGRWREAAEIAAISDDMFLPSGVNTLLNKLKGDRTP